MAYDRAELKRDVKLSMRGASPNPMLVTLLFTAVVSAGTWLINTVLGRLLTGGVSSITDIVWYYAQQGYELEEAVEAALLELFRLGFGAIFGAVVGGAVLSVFVYLWRSAMDVGYESWCLSMVRGEDPPLGRIFEALPQFAPVLVTRFLTGIFEVLWTLLVCVGYGAVLVAAVLIDVPALSVLLVVIDMAALVLGMIWVTMRYALVDYVLLDKGLYGMEALRENKRLMKGNIGRAFMLQLSFASWYFMEAGIFVVLAVVALFTLGAGYDAMPGHADAWGFVLAGSLGFLGAALLAVIGVSIFNLWLTPYVTGSMARFYDWTQGRAGSVSRGPGFGGGERGWGGYTDYTWSTGGGSGRGIGPEPGNDRPAPKSPKPPKDDPWE